MWSVNTEWGRHCCYLFRTVLLPNLLSLFHSSNFQLLLKTVFLQHLLSLSLSLFHSSNFYILV